MVAHVTVFLILLNTPCFLTLLPAVLCLLSPAALGLAGRCTADSDGCAPALMPMQVRQQNNCLIIP